MSDEAIITLQDHHLYDGELTATEREGHFNFTCNNPWAGDTESGFGAQANIALDAEQARELADWIYERLGIEVP